MPGAGSRVLPALVAAGLLVPLSGCGGHAAARTAGTSSAPASAAPASSTGPAAPPSSAGPSALPVVPAPAPASAVPDQVTKAAQDLVGRVVVLDAGHDGGNSRQAARAAAPVPAGGFTKPCNTSGASTDAGYPEHAFTFDVVDRAAALLRGRGATVVLTRTTDTGFGPCVDQRAAIANAAHADAAVSVHADGAVASGRGFHVIAPAPAPDKGNAALLQSGYRLAVALRGAFAAATAEPPSTYTAVDGLVRRSDLAGLDLARVPAAFVECANMRNSVDAALVTTPQWRQRAAQGIADGVAAFLSMRQ